MFACLFLVFVAGYDLVSSSYQCMFEIARCMGWRWKVAWLQCCKGAKVNFLLASTPYERVGGRGAKDLSPLISQRWCMEVEASLPFCFFSNE